MPGEVIRVRANGLVTSAGGLLPFGHLCWGFHDAAELEARAREYLLDGVRAGQWVGYVADADTVQLTRWLSGLDLQLGRALRAGAAGVLPVKQFYAIPGDTEVIDPVVAVTARVRGTRWALDRGFTGYRVVVDCTSVARTTWQRAAFANFEYLIDRAMSTAPVSALCAVDCRALGTEGVAQLACLHPFAPVGAAPFRIFADDGVEFAMAGVAESTSWELLRATVARILPFAANTRIAVDLRQLDYLDHRTLLGLDRLVAAHGCRLLVRGGSPVLARLARLLPLSATRFEEVAA